jgi:hypothetical protein
MIQKMIGEGFFTKFFFALWILAIMYYGLRVLYNLFWKSWDERGSKDFSDQDFQRKIKQAKQTLTGKDPVSANLSNPTSKKKELPSWQYHLTYYQELIQKKSYDEDQTLMAMIRELQWGDGEGFRKILQQQFSFWGPISEVIPWGHYVQDYWKYCELHDRTPSAGHCQWYLANKLFVQQLSLHREDIEQTPFFKKCLDQINHHDLRFSRQGGWIIEIVQARIYRLSWEKIVEWLLQIIAEEKKMKKKSSSYPHLTKGRGQFKEMAEHFFSQLALKKDRAQDQSFYGDILLNIYKEWFVVLVKACEMAEKDVLNHAGEKEEKRLQEAYKAFSLPLFSPEEEVKKAFNKEAKRSHPDSLAELKLDSAKMEQVNHRFSVLKEHYDVIRNYGKERKALLEIFNNLDKNRVKE